MVFIYNYIANYRFGNDSVLDKYQIVPALSGRIYPILIIYPQKSSTADPIQKLQKPFRESKQLDLFDSLSKSLTTEIFKSIKYARTCSNQITVIFVYCTGNYKTKNRNGCFGTRYILALIAQS